MKQVITTDLDGVQCHFNPTFHAWVNIKTGKNLNYEGQTSFNYEECWGETREYWSNLIRQFCEEGNLLKLPVIREGAEAVKLLSEKYKVIGVTFRHPSNHSTTLEYLQREVPEISDVVFEKDKAAFCQRIGAIAHVEDNLDCVLSFNNGTTAYLIDRPWNRAVEYHKRVTSWEPIIQDLTK